MSRWSSRRRAASALVALVLCAHGAPGRARADWSLLRAEDGVRVYERGADRALPELRGETEIDAPLAAVVAVIADVPGQTGWMHECIESRVVRQETPTTTLVYNRTAAPWPVSDRDVVLETTLVPPESDSAAVRFRAVASDAAPPLDGVVRMPRLDGEFALRALAPARTLVSYRVDIDPGGSLPGWLARRTARELPFETLRGLRREALARGNR